MAQGKVWPSQSLIPVGVVLVYHYCGSDQASILRTRAKTKNVTSLYQIMKTKIVTGYYSVTITEYCYLIVGNRILVENLI